MASTIVSARQQESGGGTGGSFRLARDGTGHGFVTRPVHRERGKGNEEREKREQRRPTEARIAGRLGVRPVDFARDKPGGAISPLWSASVVPKMRRVLLTDRHQTNSSCSCIPGSVGTDPPDVIIVRMQVLCWSRQVGARAIPDAVRPCRPRRRHPTGPSVPCRHFALSA